MKKKQEQSQRRIAKGDNSNKTLELSVEEPLVFCCNMIKKKREKEIKQRVMTIVMTHWKAGVTDCAKAAWVAAALYGGETALLGFVGAL